MNTAASSSSQSNGSTPQTGGETYSERSVDVPLASEGHASESLSNNYQHNSSQEPSAQGTSVNGAAGDDDDDTASSNPMARTSRFSSFLFGLVILFSTVKRGNFLDLLVDQQSFFVFVPEIRKNRFQSLKMIPIAGFSN